MSHPSPQPPASPCRFDAAHERLQIVAAWRAWLDATLDAQVSSGPARGAFDEHHHGWFDGRYAAFTLARLAASWLWRSELSADARRLRRAMEQALEFVRGRQSADGQLDLGGSYSPNEVGFTLPGLCLTYARLREDRDWNWDQFLESLREFILRGAEAVVAGQAYTANHRWAAAAGPLAAVNALWPNPKYMAKIQDYLDDGIDCDSDGCWYEERSPGYNAVACTGVMVMADFLGRPDLLDILKRHGEFVLRTLQPNGEADSTFSHRQDRHKPECAPLTYGLARRLAQLTHDGRFTSLALEVFNPTKLATAELVPLLFQIDKYREDIPEPRPISDWYEAEFKSVQVTRVRRGPSSLTVAADRGGHFFDSVRDRWGGARRSDDWFHLHHHSVIIETIHLGGAGLQNIQPAVSKRFGEGQYALSGRVPGWVHTQHFRVGAPQLFMRWEWSHAVEVQWLADCVRVQISSASPHSLGATLKLWLRAGVQVREGSGPPVQLLAGQSIVLHGGHDVQITAADGSRVLLCGLPPAAHAADFSHPSAIPAGLNEHCGSLCVGLHFPVTLALEFRLSA